MAGKSLPGGSFAFAGAGNDNLIRAGSGYTARHGQHIRQACVEGFQWEATGAVHLAEY